MITARIRRMLRELQCDPVTSWFCVLFRVLEPREMGDRAEGFAD